MKVSAEEVGYKTAGKTDFALLTDMAFYKAAIRDTDPEAALTYKTSCPCGRVHAIVGGRKPWMEAMIEYASALDRGDTEEESLRRLVHRPITKVSQLQKPNGEIDPDKLH